MIREQKFQQVLTEIFAEGVSTQTTQLASSLDLGASISKQSACRHRHDKFTNVIIETPSILASGELEEERISPTGKDEKEEEDRYEEMSLKKVLQEAHIGDFQNRTKHCFERYLAAISGSGSLLSS